MSFEVYVPASSRSKVASGNVSISCIGQVILYPGDLTKVGIKRECVVLVDTATRRIGLRAPSESEDGLREPTLLVGLNRSATRAKFSINGALKAIGVPLDEARTKVNTIVSEEHRLITLSFGALDAIAGPKRGPRK